MRAAAEVPGAEVAEGLGATAGEIAAEFRSEALAGESNTAVEDAVGRQLSGAERERFGFRESGVGEESFSNGAGAGAGGGEGAQDALHQMRIADAGPACCQAGPAVEP